MKDKVLSQLVKRIPLKNIENHAVTLIKLEGSYFISDPTNLGFLNFTDFLEATYADESNIKMDIKLWLMLMLGEVPPEEFHNIVGTTFICSDHQLLTPKLVENISNNSVELCRRNAFLLDDFHDANIGNIDTVCKTLKKAKYNKK